MLYVFANINKYPNVSVHSVIQTDTGQTAVLISQISQGILQLGKKHRTFSKSAWPGHLEKVLNF